MFDVFAVARQHAAQIREYYEAYIAVGFTEDQAWELTVILMKALAAHHD
ncbi:hypothetical protein [Streptomyces chattanoogensis]